MRPPLSICVLTYNGAHLLPDCLASIDAQQLPVETEKLIIDNGSRKPVEPVKGWQIVTCEQNRGNIGGQNACFEAAQGEWVVFVANDVRLYDHDCVRKLWNYANFLETVQGKRIGQVQPMVIKPDKTLDHFGMTWHWPGYGISNQWYNSQETQIEIVPSTIYLMRKAVWQDVGGFDESLGSSHEDVDMGLRLHATSYQNFVWADAEAVHLGNATLRHTLHHPRQVFHHARVKVVQKHYHGLNRLARLAAIQLIDHLPRR